MTNQTELHEVERGERVVDEEKGLEEKEKDESSGYFSSSTRVKLSIKSESFQWMGAEQVCKRDPDVDNIEETSAELGQGGWERAKGRESMEKVERDIERLCRAMAQCRGVATLTRAVASGWGRGGWTENMGIKT